MIIRSAIKSLPIAASAVCLVSLSPLAEEELPPIDEDDDSIIEVERCLNTRSIARTEILDDQDILFHMHNRAIYLNHLPSLCKRLAQEGRFTYRSATARLCSDDIITILADTGLGLTTGRSCKLGKFYALTAEHVERIKAPRKLEPKPVPPAKPEEPGTGQTEDTAEKEPAKQDE
jgi:hypothetical protein